MKNKINSVGLILLKKIVPYFSLKIFNTELSALGRVGLLYEQIKGKNSKNVSNLFSSFSNLENPSSGRKSFLRNKIQKWFVSNRGGGKGAKKDRKSLLGPEKNENRKKKEKSHNLFIFFSQIRKVIDRCISEMAAEIIYFLRDFFFTLLLFSLYIPPQRKLEKRGSSFSFPQFAEEKIRQLYTRK